jgi:hypothetical protein
MNDKKKIKVAFINPPHADWSLSNNAAYLMFQSHYRRHGKHQDTVQWLTAPYKFNKYDTVEDIYNDGIQNADIYLFSSYVWNADIQDELALYIKKQLPNSICVVGGPHIGTNDLEFLKTRTMYDFVLRPTKPGEVFVQELIDSYIETSGHPDYNSLSWELRSDKTCSQFMPDYSIYEEHIEFLTETREYARKTDMEPFMIIETTRGCPYSCSYCEWGGGIGTKIYKKPVDVVKKDLLALKSAGYRDVYLTDANFGVFFERDLEIFRFAFQNGVNLTDISTMKSKDLDRRIKLVDAWFEVVGSGPETHSKVITKREGGYPLVVGSVDTAESNSENDMYISVIPTVSIQSISDAAMKIANRVDLSFENKIKLSEHINKQCQTMGYPVPALELILAMPGSTVEDFYKEFEIFWNFKAGEAAMFSSRHDYMFLPDSEISHPDYLKKYNIVTVDTYTDLIDEDGVDNVNGLYKNKKHFFKTISSCFSFTRDEMCEMAVMNISSNWLLTNLYAQFQHHVDPANFGKICFNVVKSLAGFDNIWEEIQDTYNPDTPPRNLKRLSGRVRNFVIHEFLEKNKNIIYSEMYKVICIDGVTDVLGIKNTTDTVDLKEKYIPIVKINNFVEEKQK